MDTSECGEKIIGGKMMELKYKHPLRYYWRKLTQHSDKI